MKVNFDVDKLKTPCYVIDENLLEENLIKPTSSFSTART